LYDDRRTQAGREFGFRGAASRQRREIVDAFLELGELFGRLATAASFVSVCTLLQQYGASHGLTRVSFFDLQRTNARASDAIMCTNMPSGVVRRLDRAGDFSTHPLIERAREASAPFEISLPASLGFLGKNSHRPGVTLPPNGFVVPIREEGVTVAMATLVGAKPALTTLCRDKLKLAVHAGWHRGQELSAGTSAAATTSLTRRELECLSWVSRGKTDQDIARIVGVAPRTVRFHIDNAKTKLNVGSRVQAIAKLLRERPDLVKTS
jgi:LuxR family transcriptional regulator, quorum-sensing system regulator BjaR1